MIPRDIRLLSASKEFFFYLIACITCNIAILINIYFVNLLWCNTFVLILLVFFWKNVFFSNFFSFTIYFSHNFFIYFKTFIFYFTNNFFFNLFSFYLNNFFISLHIFFTFIFQTLYPVKLFNYFITSVDEFNTWIDLSISVLGHFPPGQFPPDTAPPPSRHFPPTLFRLVARFACVKIGD